MGFAVAELEYFDVGGILDVAVEFIRENNDEYEEFEENATQNDFDRF